MPNQPEYIDKNNYDDIYLRCVIVGFLGFLRNRFGWKNYSEEQGVYDVKIPVQYSLTGDSRFVMDAFYDDIPDKRVYMNTDQIPRGVLTLTNWSIKPEEFTNPNVWLNINQIEDDELISVASQMKAVPIKLSFKFDTIFSSEIDVFKAWQSYMENMWIYRYFNYTYKRIPLTANFNFVSDTENPIVRDENFGTQPEKYMTSYNFEVNTFFPIFDEKSKILANHGVNWGITIYQQNQNENLPPLYENNTGNIDL